MNMSDGRINNCGLEFNIDLEDMKYSPTPSGSRLDSEYDNCNKLYNTEK